MNGGFALKVQLDRATLERVVTTVAKAEGLALAPCRLSAKALERLESAEGPRRLVFRVFTGSDALVLTTPRNVDEDATLAQLGAALARHTRAPIALVIDGDEGTGPVKQWHRGARLAPTTGLASFTNTGSIWTFELVLPPHAKLPRPDARRLLGSLNARRPASLRELGARFTAAWRREKSGRLVAEETLLTLTFKGGALTVAAPSDEFALERTLDALDVFKFPAATRRARTALSAAELSPICVSLPRDLQLHSLERLGPPGFRYTASTYWAVASRGGKRRRFKVEAPAPVEDDRPFAVELAARIVDGFEGLAASAKRRHDAALADSYVDQLRAGDLEASARTYAKLYFANLDEGTALRRGREKIDELAVLYGVTLPGTS